MGTKTYKLNPWTRLLLIRRGYKLKCERCKQPIKVGDRVKSVYVRRRVSKGRTKFYHEECYKVRYLDV